MSDLDPPIRMPEPAPAAPANPTSPSLSGEDDDDGRRGPEEGVGLCLSGGGYRAMLFHLGALWRLNEVGWLPRLDRVASVSGGAFTGGVLACAWPDFRWERRTLRLADGTEREIEAAGDFEDAIARPLHALAEVSLDVRSVLVGLSLPGSICDRLVKAYRRHVVGDRTLQDLPDRPRFVFCAANVQTGVLFRFSKPYLADYRIGKVPDPTLPLAVAVAASTAFPPVLSPLRLRLKPGEMRPTPGADLHRPPYTTDVQLTDGGIYDNLGLETVWKRYRTVLLSDGGQPFAPAASPARDWLRHLMRINEVMLEQTRAQRRRQVVQSFVSGERKGTLWRVSGRIADYPAPGTLPCPPARAAELAAIKTRMKKMPRDLQERLVNWGYALADAGLRGWVDRDLPPPDGFPYPRVGV